MKHFRFIIIIIAVLYVLSGCGANEDKSSRSIYLDKNASYAMGMDIGTNLRMDNIYPDLKELTKGMKDALNDGKTRYTMEDAYIILNEAFTAAREKTLQENMQSEIEFLAKNKQRPGTIVTDSGLQYEVLQEGDGPKPDAEDIVKIHYEASLIDGTVFESSCGDDDCEPLVIHVYEVFSGLTEGLQLMNTGSKHRIVIPSELAYGEFGRGADVPPFSPIIFEVELLSIEDEYSHHGHSH